MEKLVRLAVICCFASWIAPLEVGADPPLLALADPTEASEADPLDDALQELADEVVTGLRSQQVSQMAVVPFQNLDGTISELGAFIAEEMTTRLYRKGNFRVVEREMLNRIMAEHELAASGIIDEATAKRLGGLLGVEALATGTLTDLGDRIRVNSRLVSTETGSVFSAAAVSLPRDGRITRLLQKAMQANGRREGAPPPAAEAGASNASAGQLFYYEDFSKVEEGLLPSGWVGGSTLAVATSTKKPGRKVLQPFQPGEHAFTVATSAFPPDWQFELESVHFFDSWRQSLIVSVGNVKVTLVGGGSEKAILHINGIRSSMQSPPRGQVFLLQIEKRGDVVKLFLDGKKAHVIRVPGLEPPRGISCRSSGGFAIYRMEVRTVE